MIDPNYDSNNENTPVHSPLFNQNKGRLARLPPEERIEIARRGGLVRSERKRLSSQINPITTGRYTSLHTWQGYPTF